jgi:hypothetical protein
MIQTRSDDINNNNNDINGNNINYSNEENRTRNKTLLGGLIGGVASNSEDRTTHIVREN